MKDLFIGVLVAITVIGFIYGSYWVAKNVSYAVFYEDMVTETILEKVKGNCINN